jgi:carboxypeptidase Q
MTFNTTPFRVYSIHTYCKTIVSVFLTIIIFGCNLMAQAVDKEHQETIKTIYNQGLADGRCHAWLETLCKQVGHRISGSTGAEKAVEWSKSVLDTLGLDSVWLQPVMVPRWVRGKKEQVEVIGSNGKTRYPLNALALGGSVGTDGKKIKGNIVEAKSWSDLERLGEKGIKGKIVFFNRPMDPTRIRSFDAYGGAVDQRVSGASKAAKYGAIGVIVRSMTQNIDKWPHTGSLRYDTAVTRIPAVAISTLDAEELSKLLKKDPELAISMQMNCQTLPDVLSYNVIGEIKGSELPNEFIIAGGHLDSWDVGEGAHDDGAGCVQSMDMLRILKKTGFKPRHTVRCVLFMNEENGLRGGTKYAEEALRKGEVHTCAIETDAGGFTPRGFTFDAADGVFEALFEKIKPLRPYFEPYNMVLNPGGGGADIGPLKPQKGLLCGYYPDSQRYFDFHHTASDVFEAVNKRELELGAASLAALIYLLDHIDLR